MPDVQQKESVDEAARLADQKLFKVYDQEVIGAQVEGIELETKEGKQLYTYRVEGGPWLTQWNDNFKSNPPRTVRVMLVENWER